MASQQITAKATKKVDGQPDQVLQATIVMDFGETLDDLIAKCNGNPEVVRSNAIANIVIGVQSGIRSKLLKGYDQSTIQEHFNNYVPGVAASRTVDISQAYFASLSTKSEAEQEAELERLREELEKRRAAAQG